MGLIILCIHLLTAAEDGVVVYACEYDTAQGTDHCLREQGGLDILLIAAEDGVVVYASEDDTAEGTDPCLQE